MNTESARFSEKSTAAFFPTMLFSTMLFSMALIQTLALSTPLSPA